MKAERFQLVVVGAGFAGSMMAMTARQLGFSVLMIERGRHPRFAIGESTTPITNLLLEEIADEFDLPFLRSFSKWGTWQENHPEIACGLKRGFTFFHHELGRPFPSDRDEAMRHQLMVGASPNERIADTHWYRPDFDQYLVRQAEALGVVYRDETVIETVAEEEDGVRLTGTRAGQSFTSSADFLIDASGPRGFLHRAFRLPEKPAEGFPATQGLYTHFTGVGSLPANFSPGQPPYPPEQAAVHHLFAGGWVWVLKFNNGMTSAGVVATDPVAERLNLRSGETGWKNLLGELPSLAAIFEPARAVLPFVWQPCIAFQSGIVTGRKWALLPSAAGVIDPLLSTGFPLTLLGVQRLARLLKIRHQPAAFAAGLDDYAHVTTREFEAAARLVKALYGRMNHFGRFKEMSLLYFAAASFSEVMRRLGKSELVGDFLLCRHPAFGSRLRELCESDDDPVTARIHAAIAPLDVIGLTDHSRDPWYPALASDLFRNASKVGANESDIAALLARCGMNG